MHWLGFGSKTQSSIQKQEQAVDQNYASSTLFMVMSSLEEIQHFYQGKGPKEFREYDHVNYSSKSLLALKSQLQTQLTLLEASLIMFTNKYGK